MKTLKFAIILFALVLFQCKESEDDTPPEVDPVQISILDLSMNESGGYTNLAIQLKLDAASDQQITAYISTTDGTAEANKDYIPIDNQAVIFAAGETEKTYEITIAGDMIIEDDEYFEVTIVSVSSGATIDVATARVDLINDDVEGIQEVSVSPTIDWTELANLTPGSEAPYEVFNFGQPSNIPNANFTSVMTQGDTITWEAKFSASGDTILYFDVEFEDEYWADQYLSDGGLNEEVSPGDSVFLSPRLIVIDNDINDVIGKYTLIIYLGTDTGRLGPFTIDPKIRIPN